MREKGQAIAKQLLFFHGVFAMQSNFPRLFVAAKRLCNCEAIALFPRLFRNSEKGLRQKGQAEGIFPWAFFATTKKGQAKQFPWAFAGAKGQSIAIDLFLGVAIFLLLLAATLAIWSNSERSASTQLFEGEMERMAEKAFDALLRSPGHPANWEQPEAGDVIAIGLAKSDRVIDENKLLQFPTAGVNRGLVAYYKMDEGGTATTTADSSGYNNTGTITNAAWPTDWQTGCKLVNCLSFDGAGDYVIIGNTPKLQQDFNSGILTVTAWIYSTLLENYDGIVSKSAGGSATTAYFDFRIGTTNYLALTLGDGIGFSTIANTGIGLTTNQWYHVAVTLDGTNVKFYVNGAQSGNPATESKKPANKTTSIRIGESFSGDSYSFHGKIDEVRVYSRALSAAEIKALYENPSGDLSSSTFLKQKLLIGDNNYFFRLWDPAGGITSSIKNSKGEIVEVGIDPDPDDPNLIKTKLSTAVVYKYKRVKELVEGKEATQHEAIAEFILYRTRQ